MTLAFGHFDFIDAAIILGFIIVAPLALALLAKFHRPLPPKRRR